MPGPSRSSEIERRLDRFLGIPLVAVVGVLRRRRPMPAVPRRIGLIQPTAIGDLVLNTGLLLHLHERFPAAELHLFLGSAVADAVPLLPVAVRVHLCDFKKIAATRAQLRGARLDVVIDLAPWPRLTALYAAFSGAFAVGFRATGQFRHWAFDRTVPYAFAGHVVDNRRALAACFGDCPDYRPRLAADLPAPPFELPYEKLILCHIAPGGSRAREKSWPAAHWAELACRLAARDYVLGFTGVAADAERVGEVLGRAALSAAQAFSLCGRLGLGELAAVLRRARLLISVDTGIPHLAAALDRPVVALHGPTRFARWGAFSAAATGLDAPHPAAGYVHFGYEKSAQADRVMPSLTVDAVEAAALARLAMAAAPAE